MNNYFNYKGYLGTIEADVEDGTLYGKIAFIRDHVDYTAQTIAKLEKEFRFSVDAYLQDCKELGKKPDVPFKGSFNVRIDPDLHRLAAMASQDQSLNAFVAEAIREKLERVQASR